MPTGLVVHNHFVIGVTENSEALAIRSRLSTSEKIIRSHNNVDRGSLFTPKKKTVCTRCHIEVLNILQHAYSKHRADYRDYFKTGPWF